jgi:hypothetical protein
MPRSRSHCRRPKLAPRGLVRGPLLCGPDSSCHAGCSRADRPELKGFLIPQRRSHVGLLADRHWRTVCATSSRGFQWVDTLRTWTIDRVIAELPWLGPLDQREPLVALPGQSDELSQALRRALQTCDGPTGVNAAVMLLKLQDAAGRNVFLEALRAATNAPREALSFLRLADLAPHDTNDKDPDHRKIKVPISGAEIFAAISRYLRKPQSEFAGDALFTCLNHDIAASRVLTRVFWPNATIAHFALSMSLRSRPVKPRTQGPTLVRSEDIPASVRDCAGTRPSRCGRRRCGWQCGLFASPSKRQTGDVPAFCSSGLCGASGVQGNELKARLQACKGGIKCASESTTGRVSVSDTFGWKASQANRSKSNHRVFSTARARSLLRLGLPSTRTSYALASTAARETRATS